ncbi:MAG: 50S ribosomal protein L4 [Planctomycetota bacterium]|nr:50S ribosomal protein L4 [Planctomycetota bacterium]
MIELPVYNESGQEVGKVQLDEKLLGEKIRRRLMHQAVVQAEADRRQGTHSTKTKGERAGSGKKPWRQKHTGRARAGMKRSPLWVKGGRIFGPKPRDYTQRMPARSRREALKSALLSKFLDKEVKVIDALAFDRPKTARLNRTLKALGMEGTTLVAVREATEALVKSARNMATCRLLRARDMNAYDVLRHKNLLFTRDVIENFREVIHA